MTINRKRQRTEDNRDELVPPTEATIPPETNQRLQHQISSPSASSILRNGIHDVAETETVNREGIKESTETDQQRNSVMDNASQPSVTNFTPRTIRNQVELGLISSYFTKINREKIGK